MKKDGVMIIAEAGVNHNGNMNMALRLCDAAKESGADVVKFQTWKTENLLTRSVKQAEYQKKNMTKEEPQFDMLKRLELSFDNFCEIKKYCDGIGITFASTADDFESLDFLVELGIPFIKIGSGDIGNIPYLRYIGTKKLPIILSTGMSTLADIDNSVNALIEGGGKDISLLHCTTNYPCPYEEVNLKAMLTLSNAFGLPVGYSDHTMGTEVSIAAVAMGAKIIEKHFTLDRKLDGPDHLASMEPEMLKKMIHQIRNVELSIGDGRKIPTKSERSIKPVITKRIVAAIDIETGEKFNVDNVCVKRSENGELASRWDYVIGKKAKKKYCIDEGIIL